MGVAHADFHVDWREFFLSRVKAGAALPKFTQADEELMGRPPAELANPLLGMALPALLLAALGFMGYRRAAPR